MPDQETIAAALLEKWLAEKNPGESGMSWMFDSGFMPAVPIGYYASVSVELKKLGGEPKEYEKCTKCGQAHEKGAVCPYARKDE